LQELSIRDLRILLDLAETGEEECPWVWSETSMELKYDRDEADQTTQKLRTYIGERENATGE
jgi:hypothetical protein